MQDRNRPVADRLRRLRGQAGAAPVTPAPDAAEALTSGPSFAERVRRLMIGPTPRRAGEPDREALSEALGAERLAPGVLLIERALGRDLRQGRHRLVAGAPGAPVPVELLRMAGFAGTDAAAPAFSYFDTETSGLAGGTGTWAFLSGFLRGGDDGWRLRQLLLTSLDAEPSYLEAVAAELRDAAPLVSYNGRTFDVPLLTTRFRLAGLRDPFDGIPHLDLLAPVRRAFGRLWPDCRLASVESRLLGFVREGDLPGSAAPAAWLGWLRQGEMGPLAAVVRHNRWDLLSLAGLVPVLEQAFSDPASLMADAHAIAVYHAGRGDTGRAIRLLESDRHRLAPPGLLELARLYRQGARWDEAVGIWESLAEAGEELARTALAKYYEHRAGDLQRALLHASALPPGPERERRCERLRAKMALGGH